MTKIKFIIFDVDGCLIDSLEVQKAAFNYSYNKVVSDGKTPPFDDFIKHSGDSLINIFKKLNLPLQMADEFRKISVELVDKVIVNKQLIEVISALRKKNIKIGICSGKDKKRIIQILKYYNIENLFDVIVGSDEVDNPKPHPEPLLKCIELLNDSYITHENTLFIGDALNDALCAKKADIISVICTWFGGKKLGIEDFVVHNPSELLGLV